MNGASSYKRSVEPRFIKISAIKIPKKIGTIIPIVKLLNDILNDNLIVYVVKINAFLSVEVED